MAVLTVFWKVGSSTDLSSEFICYISRVKYIMCISDLQAVLCTYFFQSRICFLVKNIIFPS